MSSRYSTDCKRLCRHDSWRVGCIACKQQDVIRRCALVEEESKKIQKAISALDSSIEKASTKQTHQALLEERAVLQERQDAIVNELQSMQTLRDSLVVKVKQMCAENAPMLLAAAFEEDAAIELLRLQDMRRRGAKKPSHANCSQFKTEDPNRKSSYAALDRTTIPATPDYLVNEAVGLTVFLRHARRRKPPHPMSAIGPKPGPAFMSYGSAIDLFGEPPAPGKDWPSEDPLEENEEKDEDEQDGDEVEAAPAPGTEPVAAPEPQTEREHYEKYAVLPPSVPKMSSEEQWALFDGTRFRKYSHLLIAQYAKLAKAKAEAPNVIPPESSEDATKSDTVSA